MATHISTIPALIEALRKIVTFNAATALRYQAHGAARIFSTHPDRFADVGVKDYKDAPTMRRVRLAVSPILTEGVEDLQNGILPRMGRRTAHPQGETGNARPSPLCARGTPPPQAGAPVTFHDHHCRLGHHRACRRDTVCGDLLWHPDRGRIGPHWARHGKGDSPPVPRPKCKTWTILPVCND